MRTCLALLLLSCSMLAQAAEWRDSPRLAELFKQEGVTGTFVVHDVAADTYTVHDRKRALARYVPASTFKIPNSLIGLSAGAVSNVDQVLPYGGKPTRRPEWAQDMSLRAAIKVSNVPVYRAWRGGSASSACRLPCASSATATWTPAAPSTPSGSMGP